MRFTPILLGYKHDSYSKMTSSYAEYAITPPAIYLLTLELKQSKAISSYFLPRAIASLAAFVTRIFTTVGYLTRRRITPHTRFSFGQNQFSNSRKDKGAGLLGFGDCQCCHLVNNPRGPYFNQQASEFSGVE
jgi:hypothetical protein